MNALEVEKLSEYARLDGCEVGDYVNRLLELRTYSECHGMTEEFSSQLNDELEHWLSRFKDETEIVEITEPMPDVTYSQLNWL